MFTRIVPLTALSAAALTLAACSAASVHAPATSPPAPAQHSVTSAPATTSGTAAPETPRDGTATNLVSLSNSPRVRWTLSSEEISPTLGCGTCTFDFLALSNTNGQVVAEVLDDTTSIATIDRQTGKILWRHDFAARALCQPSATLLWCELPSTDDESNDQLEALDITSGAQVGLATLPRGDGMELSVATNNAAYITWYTQDDSGVQHHVIAKYSRDGAKEWSYTYDTDDSVPTGGLEEHGIHTGTVSDALGLLGDKIYIFDQPTPGQSILRDDDGSVLPSPSGRALTIRRGVVLTQPAASQAAHIGKAALPGDSLLDLVAKDSSQDLPWFLTTDKNYHGKLKRQTIFAQSATDPSRTQWQMSDDLVPTAYCGGVLVATSYNSDSVAQSISAIDVHTGKVAWTVPSHWQGQDAWCSGTHLLTLENGAIKSYDLQDKGHSSDIVTLPSGIDAAPDPYAGTRDGLLVDQFDGGSSGSDPILGLVR